MKNGVVANGIIVREGELNPTVIVAAIVLGEGVVMGIIKSDGRGTAKTVDAIVPEHGIVDRVDQGDPGQASIHGVVGNGIVGAEVQRDAAVLRTVTNVTIDDVPVALRLKADAQRGVIAGVVSYGVPAGIVKINTS